VIIRSQSWLPHYLGGILPTMAAAMLPLIWLVPSYIKKKIIFFFFLYDFAMTHQLNPLIHDLGFVKIQTFKVLWSV
jgi:hypothetical protein